MALADDTLAALARVTAELPGGEARTGQQEMAAAVARAIESDRHLVVQAGTGTGKTLAYLVPSVLSGRPVVVATATKALQDQLAGKDLPFLAEHLGRPFRWAVLKGRSNYLCRQRMAEIDTANEQLGLDGLAERAPSEELALLQRWSEETEAGDRAELAFEPSPRAWDAVSVGARECPGATRCPQGDTCFAELARYRAAEADVVVVNTHLYGLHLASGGAVLPPHDTVVLDEAHQLEDVISATSGIDLGPGRVRALARTTKAIIADDALIDDVEDAAGLVHDALVEDLGRRLRAGPRGVLADALTRCRGVGERVLESLRRIDDSTSDDGTAGGVGARKQRAMKAVTALLDDIDALALVDDTHVTWVEGRPEAPVLRVAPVDVGDVLGASLWPEVTAVLTSATIPPLLDQRVGIPTGAFEGLDVGSPFDYQEQALLYCAAHLPDPRSSTFDERLQEELRELIDVAGGRTLALFTSWRAMDAAAEALSGGLPGALLTQRDLPKPALLEAFGQDETSCLFATLGFWQGVDVVGPSLSLVTIDRIPFPRPDEPLLQARRELARADAFRVVDLPRAATLLAQGAGRLIRSSTDRGVVAVLDPRLATAGYRWELVRALPPMRRTRERADVEAFLTSALAR